MSWQDRKRLAFLFLALACPAALAAPALGEEVVPPPPSVGTNVPASYFGPFASQIDRKLVGPVQLLRSGPLDVRRATIEIPLYLGDSALSRSHGGRTQRLVHPHGHDRQGQCGRPRPDYAAKLHYGNVGRATPRRPPEQGRRSRLRPGNGFDFSP